MGPRRGFWGRIFAINFILGVVTGIPMEFQFGTNWARFARLSGGVIGQPLAMEGVFSFFLESAFLGLFLYGEKRISQRMHWFSAVMVWLGSWISGFFIIVTDAWMQHPVAYTRCPTGTSKCSASGRLLLNPWAILQYMHNMTGAVVTGSFVMAAVGAFYLLEGRRQDYGRIFLKVGVIAGVVSSILIIFPTGDLAGKYVAQNQPAAIAAMEGLFRTRRRSAHRPHGPAQRRDGPDRQSPRGERRAELPDLRHHHAEVKGLDRFPPRPVAHGPAAALLHLPHHGGPRDLVSSCSWSSPRSCSGAGGSTPRAGCYGRCCSASRCPTLPTPPAG